MCHWQGLKIVGSGAGNTINPIIKTCLRLTEDFAKTCLRLDFRNRIKSNKNT